MEIELAQDIELEGVTNISVHQPDDPEKNNTIKSEIQSQENIFTEIA